MDLNIILTDNPLFLVIAEGIAAAKARGVRFGRPVKKPPENFAELAKLWESGKLPINKILEDSALKETAFYRLLREMRVAKGKRSPITTCTL